MRRDLFALFIASAACNAICQPSMAIEMANRQTMLGSTQYLSGSPAKYDFEGLSKKEGKLNFRSAIYEDSSGSFVRLDDEKLFDFSKDDYSKRYGDDFDSLVGLKVGINTDTTRYKVIYNEKKMMFANISGKISLFTSGPGNDNFTYMKFEDSAIRQYDYSDLSLKLSQNPESERLIQNERIGKGIGVLMIVAGIGMAGIGLLNSDKVVSDGAGGTQHEFDASPLIGIGIGTILASWIPFLVVKDNFNEALESFNQ